MVDESKWREFCKKVTFWTKTHNSTSRTSNDSDILVFSSHPSHVTRFKVPGRQLHVPLSWNGCELPVGLAVPVDQRTRLPVGYPKNSYTFQVCAKKGKVPSLKLTAIVRELIVGRQSFPVGMPFFPERTVSFREGTPIILFWRCVV